eukprot:1169712-Pyramimonas_sp.AAC.2
MAEGFDKEYGARPMRRAVTRVVHDNLSEAILNGNLEEGDTAVMYINKVTQALGVGIHRAGRAIHAEDYALLDDQPKIVYSTARRVEDEVEYVDA